LFGDKGYIGKKLADDLLRRGLAFMTRVRKNMKSLALSLLDGLAQRPQCGRDYRSYQAILLAQTAETPFRP
jgi:Transposase DDE domain